MKNFLQKSLRALFLSQAVLLSLPMLAEEVVIDGINYELDAEVFEAAVIAKSSTKYSGEVGIPESVEHEGKTYRVTSIEGNAFQYCSGLTSVTIPNSVSSIGDHAFQYCSGLTSVTIPNSVTNIGYATFYDCSGLKTVEIPNSVESIGDHAFSGCSGLTSVTIPNSITNIGDATFFGCNGLTSVAIGNSMSSIGNSAFVGCYRLTTVTIPNSVEHIGDEAFSWCEGLTSLTIGSGVTSIGESAFDNCTSLREANVSCSWKETPLYTFGNNVTLNFKNHDYSDGICTICEHKPEVDGICYNFNDEEASATVVSGNENYSGEINIPSEINHEGKTYSVTCIGDGAFYSCSDLTKISIPNSITSIGYQAFTNCSNLTNITIPNGVTSVGFEAFTGTSITSITVPNSVTSIAEGAFCSIIGLTSITVAEGNPVYDSRENCNAIIETENNALIAACNSTVIPDNVTSIGYCAFSNCNALTNYTIPKNITSIGVGAFYSCYNLKNITIPNSVTSIGAITFGGSAQLETANVGCRWNETPLYAFDEGVTVNIASHEYSRGICSGCGHATITSEEINDGTFSVYNIPMNTDLESITYKRTLSKTNTWNALYVPFEIPVTAEFCQNYDVAYFNDIHCYDNNQDGDIDGMDMEVLKVKKGTVLNANYPYLIRAKNTEALNMNIKVEDATLYKSKETTVSCSSVFMKFDVTGIYTTQTAGELKGEFDVYAMSGGGWKQALNPAQQLKPFRLYLKLSTIDGSPVKVAESALSRINIRVQGEDTETSIFEMESQEESENGIFDLSGRRVQNAQKGMYIVNGKKVIK